MAINETNTLREPYLDLAKIFYDEENYLGALFFIKEALKNLTKREQNIIELRFFHGKTQMEVAGALGLSQAQVSRLEKGAISAMRKNVTVS